MDFYPLASRVLDSLDDDPSMRGKKLGETALVARVLARHGALSAADAEAILSRVYELATAPEYLEQSRALDQAHAVLMPYAATRAAGSESPDAEAWLDVVAAIDGCWAESERFSRMEREYCLFLAGRGSLPVFSDVAWRADLIRVASFSTFHHYVLTHRVMYATDFGQTSLHEPAAVGALTLTAAHADATQNDDLLFESAFCLALLAQSPEVRGWIRHLVDHAAARFAAGEPDPIARYHEHYVLALYRAVEPDEPPEADDAPTELLVALRSEAPLLVQARAELVVSRLPELGWLAEVALARVRELAVLHEHGLLLKREAAALQQEIPRALLKAQLIAALAGLRSVVTQR